MPDQVADFFDDEAATWDDRPGHLDRAQRVAEGIRAALSPRGDERCLEFGAGTGQLSFLLVDDVAHIDVTDVSVGMIEVARAKIAEAGLGDRMSAAVRDVIADPPTTGSYDLIWSSLAIHHVADVPASLGTLRTLLAAGGAVAIADLDHDEGGHFHAHRPDFHGHHGFRRDAFGQQLRDAGFVDVSFSTVATVEKDGRDFPLFLATARATDKITTPGPD